MDRKIKTKSEVKDSQRYRIEGQCPGGSITSYGYTLGRGYQITFHIGSPPYITTKPPLEQVHKQLLEEEYSFKLILVRG